ncbi:MOB kinase activator 3C isoform X2 [Rissa tridactyla]|uniref:MOB kinase activator 3C isoform X2 n=1 Tax=Rissa tridactyla TaxID=75485 RepID=UPI0023BACC8D|nr:MOB kinase activator 3C isoform X2 [Rissa tridactyla]
MMALCLKQVFNKDKTFRPRKKFEPGTQRFELYKKAQASLKSGLDLKAVVQLPPGESINDWIAVHVVDFFNRINLIYGTMSEYCTEKSCPIMSGGLKYEYRWQDDSKYKKPTKLSAPQYMCMLMDWIEMLINNEDIFPTRIERNDRANLPLKHFGRRTQLAHSEPDRPRHPVVGDLFPRTCSGHFNSMNYEDCRRASSGQG